MNRAVLLRLLPRSRTGRRLAGAVEVVDTGEVALFRDADDLVDLLQRIHAAERPGVRTPPTARPPEVE